MCHRPEHKIKSISFTPQEHTNPFDEKKDVRVDVECTDADGSRFIVEMQVAPQNDFYDRAIYNSTFGIQQQIPQGQRPYGFPPVYFIGILTFVLEGDPGRIMYRYRLREDSSGKVMSDSLQYVFIELPRCASSEEEAKSVIDRFFYSLFNMSRMDRIPTGWDEDEIIKLLFDSANIATFTPQERAKYIHDMTTQRDFENQLVYAAQKGMEKGMEKGMVKVAKAMLAENLPLDTISRCTGLSAEEIKALSD